MRKALGLGVVLSLLGLSLVLAYATKAPCDDGAWTGQQYTVRCYTDIVPLRYTEQLQGGRLPYLDPCEDEGVCDEYPVVTMYVMRAAAWASNAWSAAVLGPDDGSDGRRGALETRAFFVANVLALVAAAVATTVALRRLVGDRVLYLVAAPTLVLYAFMNWDLLAVAAATAALLAAARRRDLAAGALLGLGTAAKLYPALFVIPLAAQRWREGDRRGAGRIAAGAAATWAALNAPFALLAPDGWSRFFTHSAERVSDWDSLWFIACHLSSGSFGCADTGLVNLGVAATFLASVAIVWWWKRRREPDFARWTLVFPVLVLFLVTGKVYSPQFSLWLLPLFALAFPDVSMFILFSLTEIAVFLSRFSYFAAYSGGTGAPLEAFEAAVVARAAVLVGCVVLWVLRPTNATPTPRPVEATAT